jgi:hypothetical protein
VLRHATLHVASPSRRSRGPRRDARRTHRSAALRACPTRTAAARRLRPAPGSPGTPDKVHRPCIPSPRASCHGRHRAARCWGRPFNGQAKPSRVHPCWETEELESECGKAGAWEEEPGDCSILIRIPHATCPAASTVRPRTSRDALCSLRRRIMRPSHTVVKSDPHHMWCFQSRSNPISRGPMAGLPSRFSARFRRIPRNACGQPVETVCRHA